MTPGVIIALIFLALLLWMARKLKRTATGYEDQDGYHTVSHGVRCLSCGQILKPGTEPFAGGICDKCNHP
jgi:hypothetical protein